MTHRHRCTHSHAHRPRVARVPRRGATAAGVGPLPAGLARAHRGVDPRGRLRTPEQVAATTRCRVAAVRRFGAFTTMELVARELAAVSRPGQFVMVTFGPRRGSPAAATDLAVHGARRAPRVADRGARRRPATVSVPSRSARRSTSPVRSARRSRPPASRARCSWAAVSAVRLCSSWPTRSAPTAPRSPPRSGSVTVVRRASPVPSTSHACGSRDRGRQRRAPGDGDRAPRCAGRPPVDDGLLLRTPAHDRGGATIGPPPPAWAAMPSLEAHMACGTGACHGCVVGTTQRLSSGLQRRSRLRSRRGGDDVSTSSVVDLRVSLGSLELEHPLVDASGTFDLLELARRSKEDWFATFRTPPTFPRRSPWTRARAIRRRASPKRPLG